jgi:hypothetical protein
LKKVKKHIDPEEFAPFKRYQENREALTKHINATEIAYALAVCTLGDPRVKEINPSTFREASSFSKADFGVKSVKRLYGWVKLKEYAELEQISVQEVRRRLNRGELGRVEKHPRSKAAIVMWSTNMCESPKAAALSLGMSQWSIEGRSPGKIAAIEFDIDDEQSIDRARSNLVHIGRRFGNAESVYSEAQELFYRGSFLNLWSSFEIFIKDSFGDLVRRFPLSLASLPDWKKLTYVYSDLVVQTNGLQDISPLRELLVSTEIAKAETGGRSISGLINLMKSMFEWSGDLYQRPYKEGGKVLRTKYADLSEIREVRNALAHQRIPQSNTLNGSSRLKFLEGRPVVDKAYLGWAQVVMSSIAHGIAEDVVEGRVSAKQNG